MTHTEACLAINLIPKVGPVRLRRLLEVFGDAPSILRAPGGPARGGERHHRRDSPQHRRLGNARWTCLRNTPAWPRPASRCSPQIPKVYPSLLRTIHDPPIVLYVWGELKQIDSQAIGIVGSRQSSFYGQETAKKLSYQLAYAGLTVISGLARGIDTAAHQGALAAKGRTVAVLGCGLSHIYPPENFALAERIADGSGAVISEFPWA